MDSYGVMTPPELQAISEAEYRAISRESEESLGAIKWGTMCDLPYYYRFAVEGGGDRFVKQLAPDCQWNYNGRVAKSREAAIAVQLENAKGSLRGLQQHGIYLLLDGNVGAALYHLHEELAEPFMGTPSPDEMRLDVLGAVRIVFNDVTLAEDVLTLEPMYLLCGEQSRTVRVAAALPPNANPQTPPEYLALIRQIFTLMLSNVNKGSPWKNSQLAIEDVQVNENGSVACGVEPFVWLVAGHNAGKGAFPEKHFKDVHILADGRLGVLEYVWESVQTEDYVGMSSDGARVRQRGMLFLEIDQWGLVIAATGVYDERELPVQIRSQSHLPSP
ncbi:MAG: hypothetical protein Q9224_004591 [Gallowayella concinna]